MPIECSQGLIDVPPGPLREEIAPSETIADAITRFSGSTFVLFRQNPRCQRDAEREETSCG